MSDEQNETLEYLRSVIGGRTEVEWFTDSITGSDLVTSPMDVFVRTTDGAVTWGWSIQPIPVDPGLRRFRPCGECRPRIPLCSVNADSILCKRRK